MKFFNLGEVVFIFHNTATIEEGLNLDIEVFVGFVVEVDQTRLQLTNLLLEFVGDGSEGSSRVLSICVR